MEPAHMKEHAAKLHGDGGGTGDRM